MDICTDFRAYKSKVAAVAVRTGGSRAYKSKGAAVAICTEGLKERYIVTHLRLQSVFIRYLLDLAEI